MYESSEYAEYHGRTEWNVGFLDVLAIFASHDGEKLCIFAKTKNCNHSSNQAMSKVMIIGAGGVGTVVAYKCAQNREVFHEIVIASRTKSE